MLKDRVESVGGFQRDVKSFVLEGEANLRFWALVVGTAAL